MKVQDVTLERLNLSFMDGNSSLSDISGLFSNETSPIVTLVAQLNVTVEVHNPNKLSFRLKNTTLTTFYRNISLAVTEAGYRRFFNSS